MAAQPRVLSVPDLFARVADRAPEPIFLLGAGASVKSGIPASGDVVQLALRWHLGHQRGWQPDDPRIMPSDVRHLLVSQPWYSPGTNQAEYFPHVMELIDQPRELRRRFLLDLLGRATQPSSGYVSLASLFQRRFVRTVLTVNFDDLVGTAWGPRGVLITVAKPDEYQAISTAPPYPQVIYLHGRAEYYMDRNLRQEVDHLDPALVERLLPLLRDHPVVVVGYRGAEPSVMCDLFADCAVRADRFKHGVYWCARTPAPTSLPSLHPLVCELAERIGNNFAVVSIPDFDALLGELASRWMELQRSRPSAIGVPAGRAVTADEALLPFDLRHSPCTVSELSDLDWAGATSRLARYAARVDDAARTPTSPDRNWAAQRMLASGLAVQANGTGRLTNAGALLLTDEPRRTARGAYVEVRLPDRPWKAVDGDLWEQHDTVMLLLDEVNAPIRMKDARSETVRPYPEAALKEVIANALVHRDYERPEPVVISATPTAIRVDSPGGLDEALLRRLLGGAYDATEPSPVPRDILQRRIEAGQRGTILTAYRNPVLADLFYGTGLIDKAGSGLADALEAVATAGGRLVAEVAEDNSRFSVTLCVRPALVDELTGTARPVVPALRAYTNLLEVLELPARLWSAPTRLTRPPDPAEHPASRGWPRFVPYDGRLHTFSDLTDNDNPLRAVVSDGDIRTQHLADFADGEDGARRLVHLLHEILFHHLGKLGLRTDWRGKRAYYACDRANARYVEYQARLRRSKRRVAWWPGSERGYCIHKAATFHFDRHGPAWALRITPTYVFTRDGLKDRLPPALATPLANRQSTEDYNQKVLHDIFFWRAVVSGGEERPVLDAGLGARIVLAASPAEAVVTPSPADNGCSTDEAVRTGDRR